MSRSYAREEVFKLVFEYVFNKEKNEDLLEDTLTDKNLSDEIGYVSEVYNGIISHYEELVDLIKENSESFKIDRIFKVDLAIMLVALYEIKYIKSIPERVSVNEALNLSKVYSTDKSGGFINGILSNFIDKK